MTTAILSVCLSIVASAIVSMYYGRKTLDMVVRLTEEFMVELNKALKEDGRE